jgi:4-amino-4-deoxy-L-arabinose transferase-like glycosyltransferase
VKAASAVGILAALSLAFIFDHGLWTPDEPRDAEIAREMHRTGRWSTPTLNLQPHLEKPPLHYWAVCASYACFGVSPASSRLPGVLFGWGTLAFTFLLGRRMFGGEAGLHAALALGTMVLFLDVSHKCLVDGALLFFTTGAAYALYEAFVSDRKLVRYLAAYGLGLGAFLSKGLLGVGLTAAFFLVFLVWTRNFRELLRAHPWFGVAILGGGAALWLAALSPELRDVFLLDNHWRRFTGQGYSGGHVRPPTYYGPALLYAFSPWTLILAPAAVWAFRAGDPIPKRFLLSWIFSGVLLLSLASTKRELYLLPLCPAAAILCAGWFEKAQLRPSWSLAPFLLFTGLLIAGHLTLWGTAAVLGEWAGLGLSIGIAAGIAAFLKDAPWPRRLALGTASLMLGLVAILAGPLDRIKNFEPFCRELPPLQRIPVFQPDETALAVIPFYTDRYVLPMNLQEAIDAAARTPAYLVFTEKRSSDALILELLKKSYPRTVLVRDLSRDRRLYLLAAP